MHIDEPLLRDVVTRTLADTAFMFAEPAPEPVDTDLWVRIAFTGPRTGEVEIATTSTFGSCLAANLLGLDIEDPDIADAAAPAVLELANILTGLLVEAAWGQANCRLGIPALSEASLVEPTVSASFLTDDGQFVQVSVRIDGEPT